LEKAVKKLTGRSFFSKHLSFALHIGIILAMFIPFGTIPVSKDLLIICATGTLITSMVSFSNFVDIPSCPALNLDFSFGLVVITVDGDLPPNCDTKSHVPSLKILALCFNNK
jgi:hypothetical protein